LTVRLQINKMAESEIDPDILSEITDNFYDKEPFGDFQLVQSNERLFREVDPDNFLEINENINTRKKTMYDMKLVNAFLMSKNETRLVQFIPPDELNSHLCNFILAVTKNDGSEYEPTTLRGFLGSVDRHLRSVDSPVSIFRDKEFSKTRAVLKRKQQELKKIGLGNKPKAAETLDEWMIAKMHEAGTLGTTNPRALLHSMWFICTTYFGMRTGKEIHQLCWGDVKLSLDEVSGTEYIILDTERQTKTRTGENPRNIRLVKFLVQLKN
jgi:hypothetical protein